MQNFAELILANHTPPSQLATRDAFYLFFTQQFWPVVTQKRVTGLTRFIPNLTTSVLKKSQKKCKKYILLNAIIGHLSNECWALAFSPFVRTRRRTPPGAGELVVGAGAPSPVYKPCPIYFEI